MPRHGKQPGYGQGKRGRHKRQRSKETEFYEKELLAPPKPSWMPQEVYREMLKLREQP